LVELRPESSWNCVVPARTSPHFVREKNGRNLFLFGAKLFEDVSAAGVLRGGDPCQPSAAAFTVRVSNGETHTKDGPIHPALLDGYWVLDCKDRADAIAWAAKIPASHSGGSVEVHPIFEM